GLISRPPQRLPRARLLPLGIALIALRGTSVAGPHERPELGMKRDRIAAVLRLAVQVGHDNDRELEPLGLVDRHQADARAFLLGGGRLLFPWGIREKVAKPRHEVAERESSLAVKRSRHSNDLARVGPLAVAQGFAEQSGLEP